MLSEEHPWHVGQSAAASVYQFAVREDADRMVAHLSTIERGWGVRHHDEIVAWKASNQPKQES